jgi:hypothetical protein
MKSLFSSTRLAALGCETLESAAEALDFSSSDKPSNIVEFNCDFGKDTPEIPENCSASESGGRIPTTESASGFGAGGFFGAGINSSDSSDEPGGNEAIN